MITNTLTQGVAYKSYSNSSAPGVPSSSSANSPGMSYTVVGLSQNSGSQSSSASSHMKRR
jgi:hypothetical protein